MKGGDAGVTNTHSTNVFVPLTDWKDGVKNQAARNQNEVKFTKDIDMSLKFLFK